MVADWIVLLTELVKLLTPEAEIFVSPPPLPVNVPVNWFKALLMTTARVSLVTTSPLTFVTALETLGVALMIPCTQFVFTPIKLPGWSTLRVLVSNEPNVGMAANTFVAIKQIRIGRIFFIYFRVGLR